MFQAFNFTVVQKPGNLNVMPGMISGLFLSEQQESRHISVLWATICQTLPDNSVQHSIPPKSRYCLSMDSIRDVQPIMSDRGLCYDAIYSRARNVFTRIDPTELREE